MLLAYETTTQSGFGHTFLLGIIIVIVVIGLAGWRIIDAQKSDSDSNQLTEMKNQSQDPMFRPVDPSSDLEKSIVLQNLGLASLTSVDISKNALRDYKSNGIKGFYLFGDKLSGNRLNPNFEFASLKNDTKVISSIDGVVTNIREQPESKDFEVFVQPKEGSQWTVGYDHLVNLTVKKGDTVKAGDPLGAPAMQNNGLLRFEIQINKDEKAGTIHVCPTALLDSKVMGTTIDEMRDMQNEWEKISGGLELYDISAQHTIGCLHKTLTPQQAEGR